MKNLNKSREKKHQLNKDLNMETKKLRKERKNLKELRNNSNNQDLCLRNKKTINNNKMK